MEITWSKFQSIQPGRSLDPATLPAVGHESLGAVLSNVTFAKIPV